MWPLGQVWKPGPTSPATVAALPTDLWFRGWFFSNPLFPSLAGFQFSVFLISAFRLKPKAEIWKAEIAGFELAVFLHFGFQLSTFNFFFSQLSAFNFQLFLQSAFLA